MQSHREVFLSRFNSLVRSFLLQYAKRITSVTKEVDVAIFMARKAACLAEALRLLRLTSFHCPVTSDRVLDLDSTWLRGKKVVVIDDALISGTSLFKTIQRLVAAGVRREDIRVIVLCVNKKWWRPALVNPEEPYLELSDEDTASLCASIVEAFSLLPLPYAIDFPILRGLRVPESELTSCLSIPDWTVDDVSSPLQRAHDVHAFTLTPCRSALVALNESLGWRFAQASLSKIRLYVRKVDRDRSAYWCQVLPMVMLHTMPAEVIDSLFNSLCRCSPRLEPDIHPLFSVSSDEHESDDRLVARTRLIRYVSSLRLASLWFRDVRGTIPNVLRLVQDQQMLCYLFSPPLLQVVRNLAALPGQHFRHAMAYDPLPASKVAFLPPVRSDLESDETLIHAALADPFLELYRTRELEARKLVRNLGTAVFEEPRYKNTLDRLNTGFPLEEFYNRLGGLPLSLDRRKIASLFLDIAVDRGMVVPITCVSKGYVSRAFRHGEDVEFGESEERLCVHMLSALSTSSGVEAVPKMWVEKALVLTMRIGLDQGFFNAWEHQLGDMRSMGIRFSLHGAVVATGSDKLYHTADTLCLTDLLHQHGYITPAGDSKFWRVSSPPAGGVHRDQASRAQLIGSVLGKLLANTAADEGAHLNTHDLVLISTCLQARDVAGALAAELDAAARDWIYGSVRFTTAPTSEQDASTNAEAVRHSRIHFCVNNGSMKHREYLKGTPWKIVEEIGQKLVDPVYRAAWATFWPPEGTQSGAAVPKELKNLIQREGNWLLRVKALVAIVESGLCYASCKSRDEVVGHVGMVRALREAEEAIRALDQDKTAAKDLSKILDSVKAKTADGSLNVPALLMHIQRKMTKETALAEGILAEVGMVAATFGRAELVSYYNHVLYVRATDAGQKTGPFYRKCLKLLNEFRGKARGSASAGDRAVLASVPPRSTPIQDGLWTVAAGPMSRPWLIRYALALIKELSGDAQFRCILFAHLPEQGALMRNGAATDYAGPLFWHRAQDVLNELEEDPRRTELLTLVFSTDQDDRQVAKEVVREARDTIVEFGTVSKLTVYEPLPAEVRVRKYTPAIKRRRVRDDELCSVGILTVVADEMKAIAGFLEKSGGCILEPGQLYARDYYLGTVPARDGGRHQIVCTRALEQGQLSIASAYEHLTQEYKPRVVALLGIGGSIHSDAGICDVVVADSIYYYDKRAEADYGTQHRALSYRIEPWLRRLVNRIQDTQGDMPEFGAVGGSPQDNFRMLFGPIGTGGAVIKHRNAEERIWLSNVNDKTLALDTEAAGASQQFDEAKLRHGYKADGFLVVRGISDHADEEKNDKWRQAAAGNAMKVLARLLESVPTDFQGIIPRGEAGEGVA